MSRSRVADMIAGLLAAAVALGSAEFAAGFVGGTSLIVEVGDAIIVHTPGPTVTAVIASLGSSAKPLLLTGVIVGALLVGALLGPIVGRWKLTAAAAFATFGVIGAVAAASDPLTDTASAVFSALVGSAAGYYALRVFLDAAAPSVPRRSGQVPSRGVVDRRRFLTVAATASGGAALAALTGVAASRRETTLLAARFGIGSLGFGFETPEETAERVEEYYRLIREECYPIGQAINPGLLVLNQFMAAKMDEEAVRRSADGPGFFSYSLGYYSTTRGRQKDERGVALIDAHEAGVTNIHRRFDALPQEQKDGRTQLREARLLTQEEIAEREPENEMARALFRAARSGSAIGSPDSIRENIKRYEDAHTDVMVFNAQCGARKHEHIMEAIELFGKQVLPEFAERHETEHRPWRERQLDGVPYPINSSI